MPFPWPGALGLRALPIETLDLSLTGALLLALAGSLGDLRRQRGGARQAGGPDPDLLAQIVSSCAAVEQAGPDPLDIAQAGFTEASRLIPLTHFLIGIFENDYFRSLLRVQDGSRSPDLRLRLKDGPLRDLAMLRDPPDEGTISERYLDPDWLQLVFDVSPPSPDSVIISPLRTAGRPFGLLILVPSSRDLDAVNAQMTLDLLSSQLANSLERHRLQEEVSARNRVVSLINEISRRLIALGPLKETFEDIATLILDAFGGDRVRLLELSDDGVVVRAVAPPSAAELVSPEHPEGEVISQVIEERRTLQYVRLALLGVEGEEQTISGLAAPLRVEGKILGVMEIETDGGLTFSHQQIELAEMIAAQLAIAALESRHFTRRQQESYVRTVLLEVARHAAQPGDPMLALQSVLHLTTLIAGTSWAILLLPNGETAQLEPAAMAGIRRSQATRLEELHFDPSDFGLRPLHHESEEPTAIPIPERLANVIGVPEANVFRLGDGEQFLGLLLTESSAGGTELDSLLAGIAHQISLRLENARLMKETALRQSLENEIAMARDIQAAFLPRQLPVHSGWEIGIDWEAAMDVGGDFYDFIQLDPSAAGARWGISVADVSGKSVPAALFMAVCRTLLRSIGPSHVDPGMVLRRMNTTLQSESLSDFFISIFYAIWEPEADAISYSNAGHNPPILVRASGGASWLSEHGMVLGVKEEVSYGTHRQFLTAGDLLVLYTDGVTEATSPQGDFFGAERLMDLCQTLHANDAQSIANEIGACVRAFSGAAALSDDMTIMTLKRTGEPDAPPRLGEQAGGR